MVPTDDALVKIRLRDLEEPICEELFNDFIALLQLLHVYIN